MHQQRMECSTEEQLLRARVHMLETELIQTRKVAEEYKHKHEQVSTDC
jgi:hypothetical protein